MMICLPGVVVQLVRIPACHAGVAGSSPVHTAKATEKVAFVLELLRTTRVFCPIRLKTD